VVEADKRRRERLSSKKGRPTPKQKPAQKKKNTGSGYDAEYRRFREQFMRDVTDPKKIREADRLAFFSGTQINLENN
jgi:predicted RNA-binding protein with RPS1 domain